MKHQSYKQNANLGLALFLALLIFFFILSLILAWDVLAQSEGGVWQIPINLSHSSGASQPVSVIDEVGRIHVIWQDVSQQFYYSMQNRDDWSDPVAILPPFGARRSNGEEAQSQRGPLYSPILVSEHDSDIHAFWIDDNQLLQHSSVDSADFALADAWTLPQTVVSSTIRMDVDIDEESNMHIAYLSKPIASESPVGIYYIQSLDKGQSWSAPELLYESSYLRVLPASDANIEVDASPADTVIVAWDDRLLERVYSIASSDNGKTWNSIREVDRRLETDGSDSLGPQAIRVGKWGNEIHLIWLAGHEGRDCAVYHQFSRDFGENWEPARRFPHEFSGCPELLKVLSIDNAALLLELQAEQELFITAWDGLRWADPVGHSNLSTIINQETYRSIQTSCHQLAELDSRNSSQTPTVIALACEEGGRGDIWASTISTSDLLDLQLPANPPEWSLATAISSSGNPFSPALISDSDGFLHAIWSQLETADSLQPTIQYSRWDGSEWSQPQTILDIPDGTEVANLKAISDGFGNLLVIWTGGLPGELFYSRNSIARALSPEDWIQPVAIPVPGLAASSADLAFDSSGNIFVAYAIPVNENRGLYMTKSDSAIETWAEISQVFDAAASKWEMVDSPKLTTTSDDKLHMVWRRFSSPPTSKPISIHYSHSADGGENWTEPILIAESPASWTKILSIGDQTIHIVWQTETDEIWHSLSSDAGDTWSAPSRIDSLTRRDGYVAATLDGADQLHLVQLSNIGSVDDPKLFGNSEIRHWTWSGREWLVQEFSEMSTIISGNVEIAVTTNGTLGLIFTGEQKSYLGEESETGVKFTSRELDLPLTVATPVRASSPTPRPEISPTFTPLPEPTATVQFPINQDSGQQLPLPVDASNPLSGSLFGILAAGILIVVVFFFGVRIIRGDQRRR